MQRCLDNRFKINDILVSSGSRITIEGELRTVVSGKLAAQADQIHHKELLELISSDLPVYLRVDKADIKIEKKSNLKSVLSFLKNNAEESAELFCLNQLLQVHSKSSSKKSRNRNVSVLNSLKPFVTQNILDTVKNTKILSETLESAVGPAAFASFLESKPAQSPIKTNVFLENVLASDLFDAKTKKEIEDVTLGLRQQQVVKKELGLKHLGGNELWELYKDLGVEANPAAQRSVEIFEKRGELATKYAWAIPNDKAIDILSNAGPIVEIGAGGGYWAALVEQNGGDIVAYDIYTPGKDNEYAKELWFDVLKGGPEKAGEHPNLALFLCWPPFEDPMAENAIRNYKGDTVIFVGESKGGCTGTDMFFDVLEENFSMTERVNIPNWPGVWDYLSVWKKSK